MTRSTRAIITPPQELAISFADEITDDFEDYSFDDDYDYSYDHYSNWDDYCYNEPDHDEPEWDDPWNVEYDTDYDY